VISDTATCDADHGDAGFTLVEMLVALALFSILAIALFDSVSAGLKEFQIVSRRADRADHGLVAQNILRRMIRDAYPFFLQDDQSRPHVDFEGAKEFISFLGDAPLVIGRSGRYRFNLSLDHHGGQTDLILTSMLELNKRSDKQTSVKTVLIDDIAGANMSYFGVAAVGQSAQWHDRWVQQSELPKLIRIRLSFRSGDTRSWPELVVAPRVYADVNCTYDPVTRRCRGR
jgi:general secretion pathway protein J